MDSFYDAPRRAPVPTQIEKFKPTPVVPEVSLISSAKPPANKFLPYSSWQTQQEKTNATCNLTSNRGNVLKEQNMPHQGHNLNFQNSSQLLKKQVRFESPVLQQRPSLGYEPFNTRKAGTQQVKSVDECCVKKNPLKNDEWTNPQQGNRLLGGKTVQEIYLANLPNSNLDLSLVESSNKTNERSAKNEEKKQLSSSCETDFKKVQCMDNLYTESKEAVIKNKENMLPKTYREFLETQKKIVKENKGKVNEPIRDIFNYKRKEFDMQNVLENKCKDYIPGPNFRSPDFVTESNGTKSNDFLSARNWTESNILEPNLTNSKEFTAEPNLTKSRNFITETNEARPVVTNNIITTTGNSNNNYPRFQLDRQLIHLPFNENNRYSNFCRQGFESYPRRSPKKCDRIIQTSIVNVPVEQPVTSSKEVESSKDDSEPTTRDLLKIIAQQNEQLLLLQKQVTMLLNKEDQQNQKQIEAPPVSQRNYLGEKCVTSTQNEMFRGPIQDGNSPRKQHALSKFSIDLMTSFEVAIRPQHTKPNFVNQEPKIQEITESEAGITKDSVSAVDKNDKTLVDTSLHLQEPVKVREMCPSPEPSININMNDYDSSEDDEVSASDIGATFYRNLMGQVNDILRKGQVQTKLDFKDGQNGIEKLKNETMKRVKEATLKHLQNIGVTIGPIEEVDEHVRFVNTNKDYSPTEISFAVKQILMKYLPDDQLAKITYKRTQSAPFTKTTKPGVIPNRPEFSFATVEYMKKYNLISNNKDMKSTDNAQVPKVSNPQKPEGPKILDITALKMQPKLL